MSEALEIIRPYLEYISTLIQVVGLPIAALGFYLSARNSAKSRNLSVLLSLIDGFRDRWESNWAKQLKSIENKLAQQTDAVMDAEQEEALSFMLNWIDSLGILTRRKILREKDVIVAAIGPALKRIILAARTQLSRDIQQHGADYWKGVMAVAELVDVKITPQTEHTT